MNSKTLRINNKHSAFALIYTMLLMVLVSLAIAAITTSTITDIKRMTKSEEVIKVTQVANAGMEKGIVQWKTDKNVTPLNKFINSDGSDSDGHYNTVLDAGTNTITTNAYYGKSRIRFRADVTPGVSGIPDTFTIYQIGF